MNKWQFYCEKCHRQFKVGAIEGTKVECFKCHQLFDVPIYEGLQAIAKEKSLIEQIFHKPTPFEELFEQSNDLKSYGKDIGERIGESIRNIFIKRVLEKVSEKIMPEKNSNYKFNIVCRCSYCSQKYITHVKNQGKIGYCHKCKEEFAITELIDISGCSQK